jgi:uncharacterized membrane protein
MKSFDGKYNLHQALKISLWFKSLFAVTELAGGLAFYFISRNFIAQVVYIVTQNELSEDPKDFVANALIDFSQNLHLSTQHFAAFYLIAHGFVKLVAIIGLLRNKLWAYPASIAIFTLFIIYQSYRFSFTHSVWLLILTFIDVAVVSMIALEYKKNRFSRTDGAS